MRHNHSRTVRVALCAAVTATTMTAGVTAAEPTPDRTGSQCPRWTALLAPGTYETTSTAGQATTGILTQLGESLTARYGSDIEVHTLAPSAGAGSVSQADLTAAVKGLCSDTRVVVSGKGPGPPGDGAGGRVLSEGTVEQVQADPKVQQVYLGTSAAESNDEESADARIG